MKIYKQNKLLYYIRGYSHIFFPSVLSAEKQIEKLNNKLSPIEQELTYNRLNYYCALPEQVRYQSNYKVKDLKKPHSPKSYFFDIYQYARHFSPELPINYLFGDITTIQKQPTITKSRPIASNNYNNVLLNLDKARHFVWIKNDRPFQTKKNLLIGRGGIYQEHRINFYKKYFGHCLCDLGQTNQSELYPEWTKPKISIAKHLEYKFILTLQGNDVASNLKWVMSSNSIAIMPKPTIETWFMEGKLQGGVHYIEIKDDYSDLEEVLHYYIAHPKACEEILHHAHQYCQQFFNPIIEDLCSYQVLQKYFHHSSQ